MGRNDLDFTSLRIYYTPQTNVGQTRGPKYRQ